MPSTSMEHRKRYSDRLGGSVNDKLRLVELMDPEVETVLDVGCNDGTFTMAMAQARDDLRITGIDIEANFIADAIQNKNKLLGAGAEEVSNVRFMALPLREHLKDNKKYDAVVFSSVLHEFYSYGEGISSVMKGIADAHDVLYSGGIILIRDMLLPQYMRDTGYLCEGIWDNLRGKEGFAMISREERKRLEKFIERYGFATDRDANHYLLKSLYGDNWDHEIMEDYTAISHEEIETMFRVLGMTVEYRQTYLLPFLRDHWARRYDLPEDILNQLYSTTILKARKR